ncbi:hypothetical protein [Micromonospora tarapacensis]|uniref:hypothetical protein n=1 Tax=Micromonospora tarapacensis TaxID=2835305 RepID=UPI001E425732|nr:hypothetical protein [Micromonospora tarapacensis]
MTETMARVAHGQREQVARLLARRPTGRANIGGGDAHDDAPEARYAVRIRQGS